MNKAAMAVSTFVEGYLWPQAPKENYGEAHFGESHPPPGAESGTAFQALQTLGSPGNIRHHRQSEGSKSRSGAKSVDTDSRATSPSP
jgi:hypothetical protein